MRRRLLIALLLLPLPSLAETLSGSARVIDGDTLRIADARLRLRAMDAFETRQTCERDGRAYACGREATRAMVQLTRERDVECSGSKRDRYRRLLVRCRADGVDLGREMVRQGWAVAEYGRDYRSDEHAARAAQAGAWAGTFERPRLWRRKRKG